MNLLGLFRRRNSTPLARERLQVLLAHERAFVGKSDLLAVLQEEIIPVIAKHVSIDRDPVQIELDRGRPDFHVGDRRRGPQHRRHRREAAAQAGAGRQLDGPPQRPGFRAEITPPGSSNPDPKPKFVVNPGPYTPFLRPRPITLPIGWHSFIFCSKKAYGKHDANRVD